MKHGSVRYDAGVFDLLTALQNGASLEAALHLVLPIKGEPPPVQDWFNDWSALGWLCLV